MAESLLEILYEIGSRESVEIIPYRAEEYPAGSGARLTAGERVSVTGSFAVGLVRAGYADLADPVLEARLKAAPGDYPLPGGNISGRNRLVLVLFSSYRLAMDTLDPISPELRPATDDKTEWALSFALRFAGRKHHHRGRRSYGPHRGRLPEPIPTPERFRGHEEAASALHARGRVGPCLACRLLPNLSMRSRPSWLMQPPGCPPARPRPLARAHATLGRR